MGNKIDFKAVATKAAGHAAGAAVYTQINKLAFMKKQTNPKVKGLISAALGYFVMPMLAQKAKLGGKGAKGDFIQHVGEGVGIVGIMQLANAFAPGNASNPSLFPTISGVEDETYPVGLITEEDMVSGYENNPVSGMEDYQPSSNGTGVPIVS